MGTPGSTSEAAFVPQLHNAKGAKGAYHHQHHKHSDGVSGKQPSVPEGSDTVKCGSRHDAKANCSNCQDCGRFTPTCREQDAQHVLLLRQCLVACSRIQNCDCGPFQRSARCKTTFKLAGARSS